jgi:hypothetical protein
MVEIEGIDSLGVQQDVSYGLLERGNHAKPKPS